MYEQNQQEHVWGEPDGDEVEEPDGDEVDDGK